MAEVGALLASARAAGLTVAAEGDELVIRGGRSAVALVRALLAAKPLVLALLAAAEPEVAARAGAMRARHPRPWRTIPFLTARDVPRGTPSCRSCGEPLAPLADGPAVRCRPCMLAAFLILEEDRRDPEATPNQVALDTERSGP